MNSPQKVEGLRDNKVAPHLPVKGMKNLVPAKVDRKKSSKTKVMNGYDESLLKDNDGNEMCFQEVRGMVWMKRRNKRREAERLAQEEQDGRGALGYGELQASADDIVTELRRNPNAARRGGAGRRATISTITPNLRPLHDGFSSDGSAGTGQKNAGNEESAWSDERSLSQVREKEQSTVKSTATKMLTFDDPTLNQRR